MAKKARKTKRKFRDLTIMEFAVVGELSANLKGLSGATLLEDCGNLLDHIESGEILGRPIFRMSDGKWYTVSIEAVVSRAPAWMVNEARDEAKSEG